MTTIMTSRKIDAPANIVWDIIADYNNAHVFHPLLASVEQISSVERGIGATRQCNLYNNSSVTEKVIEWHEGRSFTVQTNDQPIFGVTKGKLSVKSIDTNRSEVTAVTTYTPKWGLLGKTLDVFLFRMIVNNAVSKVLKGLKHHAETGDLIGKGGKPIPVKIQSARL